jgi:hypothetical protein
MHTGFGWRMFQSTRHGYGTTMLGMRVADVSHRDYRGNE